MSIELPAACSAIAVGFQEMLLVPMPMPLLLLLLLILLNFSYLCFFSICPGKREGCTERRQRRECGAFT